MSSARRDLRYGFRVLTADRSFAISAVLTLSLGVAVSTVVFGLIQNVLLRPFPYKDASRIVVFQVRDLTTTRPGRSWFQAGELLAYRRVMKSIQEYTTDADEDVLYTAQGAEKLSGALVSGNFFRFLGVPALLGRVLTPDDAAAGAPAAFVMSHGFLASRFGLDRSLLGRTFLLNGTPTTLVGIMPPRFGARAIDLWMPLSVDGPAAKTAGRFFYFQVLSRLQSSNRRAHDCRCEGTRGWPAPRMLRSDKRGRES